MVDAEPNDALQTGAIHMLNNGLLNLEQTPEQVVNAIRHNATHSHLLRLPAELRNKIFVYAMTGMRIEIEIVGPTDRSDAPLESVFQRPVCHISRAPLSFIFQIPRVCRQIYAETATLAYSYNTFMFTKGSPRSWQLVLKPAHLAAVTTIEADESYFADDEGWEGYPYWLRPWNPFPGLKTVLVPKTSFETMLESLEHGGDLETKESLRELVEREIKRLDGDQVNVIFGD